MAKKLRVLVGCEFSGVVRDAFAKLGHEAWSCDLLESEAPGKHITGDIFDVFNNKPVKITDPDSAAKTKVFRKNYFDLLIVHPECTYLCNSGVKHLYVNAARWIRNKKGKVIGENPIDRKRWKKMLAAADFFNRCMSLPVKRIIAENPREHKYARKLIGRHTFTTQPHEHGHGETKEHRFWTKGDVEPMPPSKKVKGRKARVHMESPGPNRWKNRSRTLPGIASALANFYGGKVTK